MAQRSKTHNKNSDQKDSTISQLIVKWGKEVFSKEISAQQMDDW